MVLISVKVRLKGVLSWIVNESDIVIEVEKGASLADVFVILGKRYGNELQNLLLDPDGAVSKGVVVLMDNATLPHQDFAKVRIERACAMTLVPLAAGG
jgi:hypothetical protein